MCTNDELCLYCLIMNKDHSIGLQYVYYFEFNYVIALSFMAWLCSFSQNVASIMAKLTTAIDPCPACTHDMPTDYRNSQYSLIWFLPNTDLYPTHAGNGSRFWMSHGSSYVNPLGPPYTAYWLIIIYYYYYYYYYYYIGYYYFLLLGLLLLYRQAFCCHSSINFSSNSSVHEIPFLTAK